MQFNEGCRKAIAAVCDIREGRLQENLPTPDWADFDWFNRIEPSPIRDDRVILSTTENDLKRPITVLKRDFTFWVRMDIVAIITVEGCKHDGNQKVCWSVCRVQYVVDWHEKGGLGMLWDESIPTEASTAYPEPLSDRQMLERMGTVG